MRYKRSNGILVLCNFGYAVRRPFVKVGRYRYTFVDGGLCRKAPKSAPIEENVLHQNLAPETDQNDAADDFGSPPDQHAARPAQQDARG